MCASKKRSRRVAPVSKDGAAPWFETPRTRHRTLCRTQIAAPHHEAERDREYIKLIEIRLVGACLPSVVRVWSSVSLQTS